MKVDRLISILLIIIEKKKVTAEELSKTFEVSVRTIQRDIDSLCSAGVPIYGEVGKNGGYHITENYKLDKNYISREEISILVDILKGFKDTLFKNPVRDLLNKFSIFNDDSYANKKLLIDSNPWGSNKRQNEKLDEIYKATDESRLLTFDYTNLYKQITRRTIEPYTVIMKGNSWYLYGYCTLRNDYRLFNINRIINIEIGKIFKEREDFKNIESYEIDKPRDSTKIILKTNTKFQIPEYLNPIDEITDSEGSRIISCLLPIDEWVYSALLAISNDFEVIESQYVRDELLKKIKKSIEIYKL